MSDGRNRQSLLLPLLIPLGSLAVIGLVLFGFSRVLLGVTPTAAWITALVVAAGIMSAASYVASRRSVGGGAVLSMVGAAAGIAMLSGGVALFAAAKQEGGEGPQLTKVLIVAPVGAASTGFAEDTRDVTAPAGEPFEIVFDNQDAGQQHNVVIAASNEPDAQTFLQEAPFPGADERSFPVEPLDEASYYFFCEVHPTTMTGTLEAVPPITVVAENLRFDTAEIDLRAGAPTRIVFQNKDAGTQHNLSIFRDQAYSDPIVEDPAFPGPNEVTYQVPALEAGTYYFRCDVHPTTMTGTVLVDGGAATEGQPPGEPTGGG